MSWDKKRDTFSEDRERSFTIGHTRSRDTPPTPNDDNSGQFMGPLQAIGRKHPVLPKRRNTDQPPSMTPIAIDLSTVKHHNPVERPRKAEIVDNYVRAETVVDNYEAVDDSVVNDVHVNTEDEVVDNYEAVHSSDDYDDTSESVEYDDVINQYSIIDATPASDYEVMFEKVEGDNYSSKFLYELSTSSSGTEYIDLFNNPDITYELSEDMILGCNNVLLQEIVTKSISEYGVKNFVINVLFDALSVLDINQIKIKMKRICEDSFLLNDQYENRVQHEISQSEKENLISDPVHYLDYQWIEQFIRCKTPVEYARLDRSFIDTVEKLSKVIILEKNLPNYKKSIKPTSIGGIAGGIKFITHGILFKFAEDVMVTPYLWLYGGSEADHILAAKALNNDLKSLRSLLLNRKSIHKDLHLPLMSTVNYLGYTLCAMSYLPLGKDSLCYGTSDAGKTYSNDMDDKTLHDIVNSIADTFHFKNHIVMDSLSDTYEINLAADVELHRVGSRYFILDLGRFMPPNNPKKPFVHQFRSEYIVNLDGKISCDAFVRFGIHDMNIHNSEARHHIEKFENYIKDNYLSLRVSESVTKLKDELHRAGINLRYLGFIRRCLKDEDKKYFWENQNFSTSQLINMESVVSIIDPKKKKKKLDESFKPLTSKGDEVSKYNPKLHILNDYVLMEMILRSCKSILQKELRKESEHKIISTDIFEKITYKFHRNLTDISNPFWSKRKIKKMMREKFGEFALTDEEYENKSSIFSLFRYQENGEKLIKLLPKYCNYNGGSFLFEIENKIFAKSSIPEIDTNYIISELSRLRTSDQLDFYWDKYKYLPKDDILLLAITCWQRCNDNMIYKEWIRRHYADANSSQFQSMVNACHDIRLKIRGIDVEIDDTIYHLMSEITGIASSGLRNEDIRYLASFPRLNELNLSNSVDIQEKGLQFIALLTGIRSLKMSKMTSLTNFSVELISSNQYLEELDISLCPKIDNNSMLSVSTLSNLTHLNLSGDKINDTGLLSLYSLTNLTLLCLESCTLISDTGLQLFESVNTIEVLNINECDLITDLGMAYLSNLQQLETLLMSKCKLITDEGTEYLSSLLNLTCLDLSKCIKLTDKTFQHLEHLYKLSTLILSDNPSIIGTGLKYLQTPSLKRLMMNYCQISNEAFTHLSNNRSITEIGLRKCALVSEKSILNLSQIKPLKKLDLSFNNISEESLGHLSSLSNIEEINFSSCRNIGQTLVFMKHMVRLETLMLSSTDMTNYGLLGICRITNIKTLVLSKCDAISDRGIEALMYLNMLTELDLSYCTKIQGESLHYFPELKKLDLSHCNCITGLEFLMNTPNLHTLTLCNSGLGDKEMRDMKLCSTIRNLDISSNKITDEGLRCLSHLKLDYFNISDCKSITKLGISHLVSCEIRSLCLSRCKKISEKGLSCVNLLTTLTSLDLSHNEKLRDETFKNIRDLINLKRLIVNDCINLPDDALSEMGQFSKLSELNFARCMLNDPGILNLESLVNLTSLDLSENDITDNGLHFFGYDKMIQNSTEKLTFPLLENLNLSGCSKITDLGVLQLSLLPNLKQLRILSCPNVTTHSLKSLTQTLPFLTVFPKLKYNRINE